MKYSQIKVYTGCLFPLGSFLLVFVLVLVGMLTSETGFSWLLIAGAPLGLGFCALLIAWLAVTPLNTYLMKRDLKSPESGERLAHWVTENPRREVFIGTDGLILDGKLHYWASLGMDLVDVSLNRTDDGLTLHLDLTRDYGKGPRPFDLDLPVPEGRSLEAESVVKQLLEHNTLLDKKGRRKKTA